ncbi:MAG: hypothetical protein IT452_16940 [Planctomycetia bacterium]|nr:hypothetical protein [Planctomycetia bacterium]
MAIKVGAILMGPELEDRDHPAVRALKQVQKSIREAGGEARPPEEYSLDLVYHVPGSMLVPDFSGVRTGTLSRKKQYLQVQMAVPVDFADSGFKPAFFELLRDGIRAGAELLRKRKLPFDEAACLVMVDAAEQGAGGAPEDQV